MMTDRQKNNYVFLGLLTVIAAVLIIRAFYSSTWTDEAFYLTFTDRLLKGEKLILDEWHPAQFYSVIVLPFIAVYQSVFGKTGIYLYARIFVIAVTYLVSVFFYYVLSRISSQKVSFLSSCMFLTYSRANIFGPSYYNLFLICLILALSFLFYGLGLEGAAMKRSAAGAGFFAALSVLCMPYFAPFVLLITAVFLVKIDFKQFALYVLLGLLGAAFVFVVFFLPKNISALFLNLRYIFSDPEHEIGPFANLADVLTDVVVIFRRIGLIAFLAMIGMVLCRCVFRNRWWEYLLTLLMVFSMIYGFWRFYREIPGFAYYCFAFSAMPVLLECWMDQKVNYYALTVQFLGLSAALAFALGSNTFADAPIVGVLIFSIGSLLQLDALFSERIHGATCKRMMVSLAAILVISCTLCARIVNVYRDAALSELNTKIAAGPLAGLRTTREHAEQYNALLAVINDLNYEYAAENHLLVTKLSPWCYTASDFHYGTPTAWRTPLSSPRLESYYQSHPNAIPDIVIVLAESVGNYDNVLPNENEFSGYFGDYLIQKDYIITQTEFANIYISPSAERKD